MLPYHLQKQFPSFMFSVANTLTCTLFALMIFTWVGKPASFILFLPAIMVSSWYRGFIAGIMTSILSTIAIYYFFVPPYFSFFLKSYVTVIQLFIFIAEGVVVSFIIDHGHRHEKILHFQKLDREQKKKIQSLEEELAHTKHEIASRDEFLSIASHELKTPLTTVLLQIQTSLHNIRNVSLAQFSVANLMTMMVSAESQTKRLARMINDLLNISLLTTHKMTLEIEDVDLTTLVRDCVENFVAKFQKEGASISYVANGSILGKWDKLRLEQTFDNMLSNALKYGNKKPVVVSIKKEGNNAIVTVADHGIGIASDDREKIFQLFKRSEHAEKDFKGLGIGLFIAKEIVTLHGGSIMAESSGTGTVFTIKLPIKK